MFEKNASLNYTQSYNVNSYPIYIDINLSNVAIWLSNANSYLIYRYWFLKRSGNVCFLF